VTHVIPGAIDANGLVYALARDADNSGWLFGIGIDLRPFWTYRPPYGSVSGLPLVISGGDLIVESRDERLHGPMSEWYVPLVLSVRPLEGEAWTFYPQTDALCSQYFATSLPLAGPEGTLYLAMTAGHVENQLHALGPDGSVLWQWNRSAGWRTSSALGPDGTLYLAVSESSNTRLFALGPDGQILWSTRAPGPSYTGIGLLDVIAVDPEGRLFAAGEGRLHAFSDRGQLLWTAQTPESTVTAGIAVAPDGTLLLGTQTTPSGEEPPTGWLHAFGGNGAGLWSQSLDRVPCGIPAVDAEGTAYVVARAVNTGQKSQLIAMTGAGELRFKTAFDDAFMPCGQGNNAWYVSSPMLDARGRLWFGTHSNRLLVITR
jgi:outer membrane protein assembly factor BamB